MLVVNVIKKLLNFLAQKILISQNFICIFYTLHYDVNIAKFTFKMIDLIFSCLIFNLFKQNIISHNGLENLLINISQNFYMCASLLIFFISDQLRLKIQKCKSYFCQL